MTGDEWIIIPNWEKFQHYKDRTPAWIKLYTDLAHDPNWEALSAAARGLLVTCWIEQALSRGQASVKQIQNRIGAGYKHALLESLCDAGFIELSASKPLALRYHDASPEKEKEKKGVRPRSRARASGTPSDKKLSRYAMAEAMTRNVGVQYTPASFREELDRFDLTDEERDLLEELRGSLNGTITNQEDELF